MNPQQDKQSSAVRLRELAAGYCLWQCVGVVGELGLADLLNDGPKPVDELARASRTKSGPLYRVMARPRKLWNFHGSGGPLLRPDPDGGTTSEFVGLVTPALRRPRLCRALDQRWRNRDRSRIDERDRG